MEKFKGIRFHHKDKLYPNGSIDDIWTNSSTKNYCLIIKSTTKQNSYHTMKFGVVIGDNYLLFLSLKKSLEMSKTGIIVFINPQ